MIREPAVAGTFYSAQPEKLRQDIRGFLQKTMEQRAIGIVSPHAGYMYSGHVAGAVLSRVEIPQRLVILCPNHTGLGVEASINASGTWQTPLGEAPIDEGLARRLME